MKRLLSLSIILSVLLLACTNKTTPPQLQVDASAEGGSTSVTSEACDSGECDAGEGGGSSVK